MARRAGPRGRAGTLWLGAAPGVLFRSDDGGATWEVVEGLLNHPTRERWHPGAGGMCCHSIQLDPADVKRLHIGISAAGVFRTDDAGEHWTPANSGTAADFLPDPYPELGQCVHKLLRCADSPRLWQQNHCGVYRSDDSGDSWERLDGNGLPSGFGFALALHPRDPDTAFVVPIEGAENRVTSDGRLGVYRTSDAGASWALSMDGLPEQAWTGVLREGMASDAFDPVGLYLGAQSGSVFASADEGQTWTRDRQPAPSRSLGRGGRVVVVVLPALLAAEAGGQSRFEVEATTVEEALRRSSRREIACSTSGAHSGRWSTSTSTASMCASAEGSPASSPAPRRSVWSERSRAASPRWCGMATDVL